MQCAVVEFAQNVLKIKEAASTEVSPHTSNPVIDLLPEQLSITQKGGTMRLGSYECKINAGTKAYAAYGAESIQERHRHRYEFNNDYKDQIETAGLIATGINPATNLVEIVELDNHPWFVGVQFHPELKSTVEKPHPLFVSFIEACAKHKLKKTAKTVDVANN